MNSRNIKVVSNMLQVSRRWIESGPDDRVRERQRVRGLDLKRQKKERDFRNFDVVSAPSKT